MNTVPPKDCLDVRNLTVMPRIDKGAHRWQWMLGLPQKGLIPKNLHLRAGVCLFGHQWHSAVRLRWGIA